MAESSPKPPHPDCDTMSDTSEEYDGLTQEQVRAMQTPLAAAVLLALLLLP